MCSINTWKIVENIWKTDITVLYVNWSVERGKNCYKPIYKEILDFQTYQCVSWPWQYLYCGWNRAEHLGRSRGVAGTGPSLWCVPGRYQTLVLSPPQRYALPGPRVCQQWPPPQTQQLPLALKHTDFVRKQDDKKTRDKKTIVGKKTGLKGTNAEPTCSTETFQQQVQKLFIDILIDVDLWGEQDCPCVRNSQVLTANSKWQ